MATAGQHRIVIIGARDYELKPAPLLTFIHTTTQRRDTWLLKRRGLASGRGANGTEWQLRDVSPHDVETLVRLDGASSTAHQEPALPMAEVLAAVIDRKPGVVPSSTGNWSGPLSVASTVTRRGSCDSHSTECATARARKQSGR